MNDLLTALATRLHTQFDRQGRAHAVCPACGAEPTNRIGGAAYHFYLYDLPGGKQGAVCWACGYRPRLTELATELDVTGYIPPQPRAVTPPPPAPWQAPDALVAYRAFQDRQWADVLHAWQQYKPLAAPTIRLADLGLGRLPLWDDQRQVWYPYRYERLIVPLLQDGQIVGLRGRAIHPADTGPKWLTASFSETLLMGLNTVQPGDTVIWCENVIDRLLAQQVEPHARYVASGGLTWRDAWLDDMAQRCPAQVLIWFDNDLAGCPNATTAQAAAQRRIAEGKPPSPPPRGPKLANALLQRGVRARVYAWPAGTPEHADLGWLLTTTRREAV